MKFYPLEELPDPLLPEKVDLMAEYSKSQTALLVAQKRIASLELEVIELKRANQLLKGANQ